MDVIQFLSIVHIAPIAHAIKLNELAVTLGMGEDNLSIHLVDADNNQYLANHSWWAKDKYTAFKNRDALAALGVDMTRYGEALDNLHEFVIDTESMENIDNVPIQNFENALSELNLTQEKALY